MMNWSRLCNLFLIRRYKLPEIRYLVGETKIGFFRRRQKYLIQRESVSFLLYNDIHFFKNYFLKKGFSNQIVYLKLCHTIKGKEANVYEFHFVNHQFTLHVNLRNCLSNENEELLVVYYVNDRARFFVDLTSKYLEGKRKNNKQVHFHFKNGNVNIIELYKRMNFYEIKYFILLVLFILLVFLSKCW